MKRSHMYYSLPQKKVYSFVEPSTQKGGQMESRGCARHSIELEFQNKAWSSLDQLKGATRAGQW